jgi:nicotinate-nucleotide adenylyltransferase
MKTGILGGTFNPVHLAHLRIAEEVRESCELDRVLFMPAATPPHKPLADDVPFADRLAMVEAAIAGNPAFAASDLESQRPGKSYSVRTLELLHQANPGEEFCYDENPNRLRHRSGKRVILLEETFLDISSTHIRQLVAGGRSIRYLVPAVVEEYINRHGFYRCQERS